jgi:hypothetical protein
LALAQRDFSYGWKITVRSLLLNYCKKERRGERTREKEEKKKGRREREKSKSTILHNIILRVLKLRSPSNITNYYYSFQNKHFIKK